MDNNENSEKMPSSPFSSPCSHSDHPKTGVPGVSLHYCDTQSEIHRIVVGDLDNNVFFLRCRETGESVLIDAANELKVPIEEITHKYTTIYNNNVVVCVCTYI